MRAQLWDYNFTKIDLEDLDVTVQLAHPRSLATVTLEFRVDQTAMAASAGDLKGRVEQIAREILLNLATSLEPAGALTP
ncbi:hypothetical protein HNE_1457 [Hyphomonas neptunium ATCC 15444]|uniref:Uncharacterized protein n=2 Tax=Hyphomonas TaxID=85 RepID=Q0C271_HYPNA|nr:MULTISPECIES: hypothetical protein [Hyphomonas]ABI75368.1 hypothetical protein HNE_1457 [Hyphomonas neptunium ATCC 15444]KCZ93115.1 hypothetical protein HHI_10539 [Hyphomonas hirschiana VP5]